MFQQIVALAEWLRRVPAKYMGFPRESSNLSGDVLCFFFFFSLFLDSHELKDLGRPCHWFGWIHFQNKFQEWMRSVRMWLWESTRNSVLTLRRKQKDVSLENTVNDAKWSHHNCKTLHLFPCQWLINESWLKMANPNNYLFIYYYYYLKKMLNYYY